MVFFLMGILLPPSSVIATDELSNSSLQLASADLVPESLFSSTNRGELQEKYRQSPTDELIKVGYHLSQAVLHYKQGDLPKAIQEIESAKRLDAKALNILLVSAQLDMNSKRFEEAKRKCRLILEINPDNKKAKKLLGHIIDSERTNPE
jgi:tetratricopeptide (TPR) repeat protein